MGCDVLLSPCVATVSCACPNAVLAPIWPPAGRSMPLPHGRSTGPPSCSTTGMRKCYRPSSRLMSSARRGSAAPRQGPSCSSACQLSPADAPHGFQGIDTGRGPCGNHDGQQCGTPMDTDTAHRNAARSHARKPGRTPERSCEAPNAPARPTELPRPHTLTPSPTTIRRTLDGSAPKANRMPISWWRLTTVRMGATPKTG